MLAQYSFQIFFIKVYVVGPPLNRLDSNGYPQHKVILRLRNRLKGMCGKYIKDGMCLVFTEDEGYWFCL